MALEIEDGTGKVDGQSYVDAAEARQFALARGVTLPAAGGTDPVEAMLMQAMDFVESMESRMKGKRANANKPTFLQALSWPRTGVRIGCEYDEYPSDQIPANLTAAVCHLVLAVHQGYSLLPTIDPNQRLVKRKKVDVLETEYFSPKESGASYGSSPIFPVVDALLRPLLRAGGGYSAPAYRV